MEEIQNRESLAVIGIELCGNQAMQALQVPETILGVENILILLTEPDIDLDYLDFQAHLAHLGTAK